MQVLRSKRKQLTGTDWIYCTVVALANSKCQQGIVGNIYRRASEGLSLKYVRIWSARDCLFHSDGGAVAIVAHNIDRPIEQTSMPISLDRASIVAESALDLGILWPAVRSHGYICIGDVFRYGEEAIP